MNRPVFLLQGRALLLACILAMGVGACAVAADGTLRPSQAWADDAQQAQADAEGVSQAEGADAATQEGEGEAEEAGATSKGDEKETPVGAEQIAAFLGDKGFALAGAGLSFEKEQLANIQVVVADGEVWVLDASTEDAKTIRAIEDKLVKACVQCLEKSEPQFGSVLPSTKALEQRVQAAVWGKLTEVRAYTLAHALMFHKLAPSEGVAPSEQELKDARVIDVPASPLSVRVHWVVLPPAADGGQGAEAGDPGTASNPQDEVGNQGEGSPATDNGETPENTGSQPAPAETPEEEQPAEPGGIQVEQDPGDNQPTQERVWVVDQAAWDESVLENEAWDEDVWVPKQEWVANNVWVQDSPAWDEQVVAKPGYMLNVPARAYYLFKADGFKTYDDDEMERHIKQLINEDKITNYEVKVEYEQVWQEPEYETVHHEEVGHWEDQGSYQDNGHYETVHHAAVYTTVHHDEVGHWE